MIDERKARRVIDFIQCLKHTKGEFHGKPSGCSLAGKDHPRRIRHGA